MSYNGNDTVDLMSGILEAISAGAEQVVLHYNEYDLFRHTGLTRIYFNLAFFLIPDRHVVPLCLFSRIERGLLDESVEN